MLLKKMNEFDEKRTFQKQYLAVKVEEYANELFQFQNRFNSSNVKESDCGKVYSKETFLKKEYQFTCKLPDCCKSSIEINTYDELILLRDALIDVYGK
ncbi:hypothetical protein SNEBB_003475 [Seison nebaliae]|nr:hypothetical protein SNEBB_003475 [Seison nebaliae]